MINLILSMILAGSLTNGTPEANTYSIICVSGGKIVLQIDEVKVQRHIESNYYQVEVVRGPNDLPKGSVVKAPQSMCFISVPIKGETK